MRASAAQPATTAARARQLRRSTIHPLAAEVRRPVPRAATYTMLSKRTTRACALTAMLPKVPGSSLARHLASAFVTPWSPCCPAGDQSSVLFGRARRRGRPATCARARCWPSTRSARKPARYSRRRRCRLRSRFSPRSAVPCESQPRLRLRAFAARPGELRWADRNEEPSNHLPRVLRRQVVARRRKPCSDCGSDRTSRARANGRPHADPQAARPATPPRRTRHCG